MSETKLEMLVVTCDSISGKEFETLGTVRGVVVQSKNVGVDILQSFKSIVGGELKGYTDMMTQAREIATERMIEHAQKLGADAVVTVRYTTAELMEGCAEILAYGTAVKFK